MAIDCQYYRSRAVILRSGLELTIIDTNATILSQKIRCKITTFFKAFCVLRLFLVSI